MRFEVFRNPGHSIAVPFVVQIQSRRLAAGHGRVVMVRCGPRSPADRPLTPYLTVAGALVYANPMDLATLRAAALRETVCVLEERDQDRIVRAIDEMISRA